MLRVVVVVVALVLLFAALIDLSRAPAGKRAPWFFIVLVPIVGPLAWFFYGNRPDLGPGGKKRIVGPDDDPDYLWRIEKELRKRKKDKDEK
ncbi:MAG: PLDc N-terminal domain-containing protein [Candidatus Nanopelagicales bacterium]